MRRPLIGLDNHRREKAIRNRKSAYRSYLKKKEQMGIVKTAGIQKHMLADLHEVLNSETSSEETFTCLRDMQNAKRMRCIGHRKAGDSFLGHFALKSALQP